MYTVLLNLVVIFLFFPLYSLGIKKAVTFPPKYSVFYRFSLLILGSQALVASIAVCMSTTKAVTLSMNDYVAGRFGLLESFKAVSIVTLYFDRVSLTMFSFISFIALVVYRYSLTYLDGEAKQPSFMLTLAGAIFSAQALVISGNLVLFALCWIALSLSLHALLEYYPERQRAILAARKKFIISRIGDGFLLLGILALYYHFNTADIVSLFKIANGTVRSVDILYFQIAALCIVGAAVCKSAQVPFHTWLPDTLEAPTPVSALMHAGIVNGGGYALIRFSPLFTSAELALNIATGVGAGTAVVGMVVMWTQTTIKKSLAWSTVMQMGFMILQCGLGAYALAFIHILGHGFYKAHAFLLSGTISESRQPPLVSASFRKSVSLLSVGIIISGVLVWVVTTTTGIDANNWPGGLISLFVLMLALAQVAVPQFNTDNPNWLLRILSSAALICFVIVSEVVVSNFYGASFANVPPLLDRGVAGYIIAAVILTFFLGLSLLSCALPFLTNSKYGERLYTHAVNGFYIGLYADRFARFLWPQEKPKTIAVPVSILRGRL